MSAELQPIDGCFECESCHAQQYWCIWQGDVWKCLNCGHWNTDDGAPAGEKQ